MSWNKRPSVSYSHGARTRGQILCPPCKQRCLDAVLQDSLKAVSLRIRLAYQGHWRHNPHKRPRTTLRPVVLILTGPTLMSAPLPDSGKSWLSVILRRPYTLSATLFLALFVIPFCTRKQSDWEYVYIPAAQRLSEGKDVFERGFVYPPINVWLMLPFVGMPRIPARLLWFALNGTALLILIRGAWKVSGGGALEGAQPASRREHMIFGLGLLCGIYYAFDALTNQQTDLLVAALVIAGCQALGRRNDWKAGLLIGVAAGVKCTPLLWAGYLARRKPWAGPFLFPLVSPGLNLLPPLTNPPPT